MNDQQEQITVALSLTEIEQLLDWTDGYYKCADRDHGIAYERLKIKRLRDKLALAATQYKRTHRL